MRSSRESGQAVLLVVVAMGIFMLGGMGLAIDVSNLYFHQQMAQVAADAAAQAAMMSIFQGINKPALTTGSNFPVTAFNCASGSMQLPCQYARMNGFEGGGASDTVAVSFPTCSSCSYAALLASGTPNQVQVTITRQVNNTLIRMVGAGAFSSISATGIAAILSVTAPVPILIIHPTLPGALDGTGTSRIEIYGGPSRSIQVNSRARLDAYGDGGSTIGVIDLSHAGPNGNGADFGVFGGPTSPPSSTTWTLGTGRYVQPASPIPDPLLDVKYPGDPTMVPPDPAIPAAPAPIGVTPTSSPNYGCADTSPQGCTVYQPGRYSAGIQQKQGTAIFQPGVYIMENGKGFSIEATGAGQMCVTTAIGGGWPAPGTGCVADPVTADGMLVYNQDGGVFNITGAGAAHLKGTPETDAGGNLARYAGILFFQDRGSPAAHGPGANNYHYLGGGGCLDLIGTIYVTNTEATITASGGSTYQTVRYAGNPCSGTIRNGMVITDSLELVGTALLRMQLNPMGYLKVRQVALVGGGAHP